MYSPQIGQSQSVDRSMHRCVSRMATDKQAEHVYLNQHDAQNTRRGLTLQWKKSLPSPCPTRQIPQSSQW